jgi:uncharacterized protein involved in tellurium resistance
MIIDLNKITLEKQGDSHRINLAKVGENISKKITINLNRTPKKDFWTSLTQSAVDFDLGRWYELRDGSKSCIDGSQFANGQDVGIWYSDESKVRMEASEVTSCFRPFSLFYYYSQH